MASRLPRAAAVVALLVSAACSTSTWNAADMDPSVAPGDDFYRYANGGWLDRNPVPAEFSSYGVGREVHERNQVILRAILEEAAAAGAPAGSTLQQLGDFYASGLDEARIEALGIAPLAPFLARIDAVRDLPSLQAALLELHRHGVPALFGYEVDADPRDSSIMIAYLAQAGLGLPEKDYYLREDAESAGLREQYREHIAHMLELLGAPAGDAAAQAARVLALETRLAGASFGAVEMRDPAVYDEKHAVAEADAFLGDFDLAAHLAGMGLPDLAEINLIGGGFFQELGRMFAEVETADWRAYLRWQLARAAAPGLGADFVAENFRFYGNILSGAQEIQPRWKRVLGAANGALGELLGQAYVARAFSPRAKERALAMVEDLLWAMRQRLEASDWMDAATRAKALEKLATFRAKIGYPDAWRDYSGLDIQRDSYAANLLRARAFEVRWQLARAGRPVDPGEWGMVPQVVNAYYHPLRNEIVFPAGILQPPFFDERSDDALNYGAMGAVIGHEITHGFDDAGAQFDARGEFHNWWTEKDLAEFRRRGDALAAQFDGDEVLPGVHVNGRLTLGENIADQGGVLIAYEALQHRLAQGGAGARRRLDGFTPEQRFFLSYARSWRQNARDEYLKLQVNTDPHAPARFRCLGVVRNLPQFAAAWGLESGNPMALPAERRALVW